MYTSSRVYAYGVPARVVQDMTMQLPSSPVPEAEVNLTSYDKLESLLKTAIYFSSASVITECHHLLSLVLTH